MLPNVRRNKQWFLEIRRHLLVDMELRMFANPPAHCSVSLADVSLQQSAIVPLLFIYLFTFQERNIKICKHLCIYN